MYKSTEETHLMWFNRYLAEKIKLDYWWIDAGWYQCDPVGWPKVGTWEVDKKRFPHGLKAVTDYVHSKGVKSLLWFEPERVAAGSWLAENRPEWILGGKQGGLLNFGNPDVLKWITDRVDKVLTEEGIDLYRQDFNMDPLGYWRGADAEDRQGITEIRHVTNLLAYWDELKRRHPNILFDECASGGPSDDCVITPVYHEKAGLVLSCSSWPDKVLVAIKPDGQGNVTSSKVVWRTSEGAPYVPSPIAVGDWFLTSAYGGKAAHCYEAATGKVLWKEPIGLHHASPISANGLVYFLNDDGVMHVVRAGLKFDLVARNELGEKTYASPALSGDQLFLRGFKNLYCIGKPAQ